jgi:hypothetical protein
LLPGLDFHRGPELGAAGRSEIKIHESFDLGRFPDREGDPRSVES